MATETSDTHDAWTAFVDGLRAAGDQLAADTAGFDPVQQADAFSALLRGLNNPRHAHGAHRYAAADFGLDACELRERFAFVDATN